MNQLAHGAVVLLLLARCATPGVPLAAPVSVEDRAFVAAVLDIDERSGKLLSAANFSADHKELQALGDEMAHRHEKRTRSLREWQKGLDTQGSSEPLAAPCASDPFDRPASGGDVALLDALIRHRTCLLQLAQSTQKMTRNPGVRHFADDLAADAEAELRQLAVWRRAWGE